jgi:hypothetical protein
MRHRCILNYRFIFVALVFAIFSPGVIAEVLFVDSTNGNDINPGTKEKPLKTISKAAKLVNSSTKPGPTTIKVAPGVYALAETVVFENNRPYTEEKRLIIEATVLPDEPQWKPALMPVILSAEDPRKTGESDKLTETYSIKVKISHVTVQGLKFLGNPLLKNWHCCIERIGEKLNDLVVRQCVFVADRDGLNIYCATLATGDRFIVDHCIFKDCGACIVFWDGLEEIGGNGCTMRYCIVDSAYTSGVWTCQTAEDFEFHHNIINGSEYFWMRKHGDLQRYKIEKCVVIGNKYWSGYGVASGPTGQTGPEVIYKEKNVVKEGQVVLVKDKTSRNYLHVVPGTSGSDLGAGLFKKNKPIGRSK